jgi:nucleoside-diphosphate-sugar epimerase
MTIEIKGKKILLIGGAGFVGHHLGQALVAKGAKVDIVDSLQVNNLGSISAAEKNSPNRQLYTHLINERLERLRAAEIGLHILDARDYLTLSQTFDQIKPDIVVQLAAIAHANRANKDPFSTFDHSLRTLENALDCARDNVEHFIYMSSSMVYGNFATGSVDEETHCEPLGIYGSLKFSGEKIVIAYNQVFDLPYTIVRPSALYGERCISRRVGQIFIEKAIRGEALEIHGDGSDSLDFTYIEDLVQGLAKIMEQEKAKNEVFNLTYGQGRSIDELVSVLRESFSDIDLSYSPKDALMPDRGTLSVEKAKTLIGYDPQFPIEVGFKQYIQYYKDLQAASPEVF